MLTYLPQFPYISFENMSWKASFLFTARQIRPTVKDLGSVMHFQGRAENVLRESQYAWTMSYHWLSKTLEGAGGIENSITDVST
jgi:hypothetical protein